MAGEPTEPGTPHPLTIDTTDTSDTRCLITVHGDVDLDTSPRLAEATDNALSRGRLHITVDMSAVTFIDSTAVTALLRAQETALGVDGSLRITAASTVVLRILDIAGLTEQLLDPGD